MITNTHSVGVVRDAAVKWMVAKGWKAEWNVPVAAETWDGLLNDLNGFHVRESHALAALDAARAGPVAEGNVGGGTGMVCSRFKGGIGTASRRLPAAQGGYTVGVLVQCNYGARNILRIAGAPVGAELKDTDLPCYTRPQAAPRFPFATCGAPAAARAEGDGTARADGSIIVVVATDAPLLPHQLRRLAKRPSLGLGRLGSIASDGSGDIFIAFSTANPGLRSVDQGPAREPWPCIPTICSPAVRSRHPGHRRSGRERAGRGPDDGGCGRSARLGFAARSAPGHPAQIWQAQRGCRIRRALIGQWPGFMVRPVTRFPVRSKRRRSPRGAAMRKSAGPVGSSSARPCGGR